MLSIRFDEENEWWVSNQVFERLFICALEHGHVARELEEWRHVAEANGGLSFSSDEVGAARELADGLRSAAAAELAQLGNVDVQTQDGAYKTSLEKLLAMVTLL